MKMTEKEENQVMAALRELMTESKVRSFLKEGGDPGNEDDWMYEKIDQNND